MTREDFIYHNVTKNMRILEFAPYFRPMYPKAAGYHTEIVDVHTREELIQKGKDDPNVSDISQIEEVDYVCGANYAEHIGEEGCYDLVAASHLIEHTTDIIAYLRDCSKLLKPDGTVRQIIPDKRYDFDCFREVTSIRTVIDTHLGRGDAEVHSVGTVADHILHVCRCKKEWGGTRPGTYIPNSVYLLDGEALTFSSSYREEQIEELERLTGTFDEKRYIGCHSWVMTPKSFELMIYELNLLGYIDLVIDKIYTNRRSIEFWVDLKKGRIEKDDPKRRLELCIDRKREELEACEDWIEAERLREVVERERPDVYIFGTGGGISRAAACLDALGYGYEAHVVSDGRRTEEECNGHPVLELSELPEDKDFVILLGVEKYRDEVEPVLKAKGYRVFL